MGRFGREEKRRRPLFGTDLRIGAVLAGILAVKFAPPMLSAKIDKRNGPPAATLVDSSGRVRPSDALTNILPTGMSAASAKAEDPPVLSAPLFALEEKPPTLADPPKLSAVEPPKPSSAKPVKLKDPPPVKRDEPKKAPPIVFADAPKEVVEANATETKKPAERTGPVHPYFQRYLDQKEYFVRPGDTLESIAHRLFQDDKKTADILAVNKDQLPTASALKPGMTIKLP
jgi:hypothetical protein